MAREMERMILYRVTVVLQAMVFTDLPGGCRVCCVSFKTIFWGGEPPHLYHPTLLNDTLLKCFGNISNRVSCQ